MGQRACRRPQQSHHQDSGQGAGQGVRPRALERAWSLLCSDRRDSMYFAFSYLSESLTENLSCVFSHGSVLPSLYLKLPRRRVYKRRQSLSVPRRQTRPLPTGAYFLEQMLCAFQKERRSCSTTALRSMDSRRKYLSRSRGPWARWRPSCCQRSI